MVRLGLDDRMAKRSGARWAMADGLVVLVSMWLAGSRQMMFLDAVVDDRLFAKLANSIQDGHWLGAYDKLTLAKGPGYPAFMALTSTAGIPLRLAEQAVYLLGCWLISRCIGRLSDRRALGTAVFAAAALNPLLWGDSLARVVRENLYAGLTVVVLGLAMHTFLSREEPHAGIKRLAWGGLLGIAFGWFWLTREEGVWLVPALGVLAAYWLWQRWSRRPASVTPSYAGMTALVLMVPCLTFAAVDLGVAAVNYKVYGVFETNDFRSDEFRSAYGALSRIQHERWQRLIPVPQDARVKAYAVSPAMRELRPYLEGDIGKRWQQDGCSLWPLDPCNEIQAGWFMWALRDAVEGAQHYTSATEARRFYRLMAREVNAACEAGRIACLPPRDGFLPPLRREYLPVIARDAWRLGELLGELGREKPASLPGVSTPEVVREFRQVARGPWVEQNLGDRNDPSASWRIVGWVFAWKGHLEVSVERDAGPAEPVVNADAPDVLRLLDLSPGTAVRFVGTVHCGGRHCQLVINHDGVRSALDMATLQPGSVTAPNGLRLWLDEIGPPQSTPERPSAARLVTIGISATLRAIGSALLPTCVLAGAFLLAVDLWGRRLRAITVVWLALLAAMSARIAMLAVLNATSLPAVSPLYLSPAVGLALIYMAGVAGWGVMRLLEVTLARRAVRVWA